jgi:ADP-dependent phosphofructokinase/glucokinase
MTLQPIAQDTDAQIIDLVAQFEAAISTNTTRLKKDGTPYKVREAKHVIDDEDFVAMMFRLVRRLEKRAIDNPAILATIRALGHRLDEVVNVAIAANAQNYAKDPRLGASMQECADILEVSRTAASKRAARGRLVMLNRIVDAGAVPFAEKKREREEFIAPAEEIANVVLVDFRARRAS